MSNLSEFIERAKLVKAGDYESDVHNHLPGDLLDQLGVKYTQTETIDAEGKKLRTLTFTHHTGASASFIIDILDDNDATQNRVAAVSQ